MPGGAYVNAAAFDSAAGIDVTVATAAVAADETVAVNEVTADVGASAGGHLIPAGTTLRFAAGEFATLTEPVDEGDTSIAVEPLDAGLTAGNTATYNRTGRTELPSGTPLGRTQAEMEADDPFQPADPATQDEFYLTVYTKFDVDQGEGVELLRPGTLVYYNHLPGWDNLSTAIQDEIRAVYEVQKGVE